MNVSLFTFNSSKDDDVQIALVSFERQRTFSEVSSILHDEYKSKLQGVDIIILRPAVDLQILKTHAPRLPPSTLEQKLSLMDRIKSRVSRIFGRVAQEISQDNYDSIEAIHYLEDEIIKAQDVVNRFPHLPVYLLFSEKYEIFLSENINLQFDKNRLLRFDKNLLIQFVRQKELELFVLNSSAIIVSGPTVIFKTPSNEFSHSFLRVGNIQTNKYVLDALFFWSLPYLKEVGGILTDSWTISSIALNMARFICRYDKNIKIEDFHINMMSSFFNGIKTLDKETERSLYNLLSTSRSKILFLMSAIKTQKSLNNIKNSIDSLSIKDSLKYLTIYRLIDENEIDYLCDLGVEFQKNNAISFDTFVEPPKGESVVEIDEKIFFPIQAVEKEIPINKKCVESVSDFFRNYEGNNVIYIHRDSFYINKDYFRHHGIYIDITNLLKCEIFLNKLKEKVNSISKCPAFIIYPPHEHGKNLVQKIAEYLKNLYGVDIECVQIIDLDFLEKTEHASLKERIRLLKDDDLILIVDDVSVSGTRLRNYQKRLRGVYNGELHYFVGVARPDCEKSWKRVERDLKHRGENKGSKNHNITFVEKIYMPNWDNENCPWCKEYKLLKGIIEKPEHRIQKVNHRLFQRWTYLDTNKEHGLLNDVYFSINDLPKPQFKGGSIFIDKKDVSEADLTAIVACSIQYLRNEGVNLQPGNPTIKLNNDFLHRKIISIQDYLMASSSFNEALIKAAIMRTAYRHEIHATSFANETIQQDCVLGFLENTGIEKEEIGLFKYELYLALKEKKLPKPKIKYKLYQMLVDAHNSN